MELTLRPDEARLLHQVLTQHASDLKLEIGKTENYDWRQEQKRDYETLRAMIARLEPAATEVERVEASAARTG